MTLTNKIWLIISLVKIPIKKVEKIFGTSVLRQELQDMDFCHIPIWFRLREMAGNH